MVVRALRVAGVSLESIFSGRQISRDPDALATWGKDWTTGYDPAPSAVVFPETVEQVQELVRFAVADRVSLVPSGGRTGLSGGAVAADGEVVVSFDRMHSVIEFEPRDRLVRCQPGLVTESLQAYAREQGLAYPVDFASAGSSQIGGNIATNAGGIKVIRYGLTRDWVAGLTVVTGAGDLLECNQGLVKNATGYDFRHLFIGSEGTLGFVVEAQMRLAPEPAPQVVMVLSVRRFGQVLEILDAYSQALTLSAFEFFSESALQKVTAHRELQRPFEDAQDFYALLEFDVGDLEIALTTFERLTSAGVVVDGVASQSDAQAKALWALREGISEAISGYSPYKNDLSVRVSHMPSFIDEVDQLVAELYPDFEVCWYGHIGDGNLHLNILKPEAMAIADFQSRCHTLSPHIFERVAAHRGSVSAEHGVGVLKRDFLSLYSQRCGDRVDALGQVDARPGGDHESGETVGLNGVRPLKGV